MDELLAIAIAAARDAGGLLLERFRRPRTGVGSKSSPTDVVTDADREAEALIRARISSARRADAILGEESGESAGTSGLRWVIDPLDGTTNYLYGLPHWAVSIACEDSQGAVVGVVHDPLRGETFTAVRDGGASLEDVPIEVSREADLTKALIATGFSYRPAEREAQALMLSRMLHRVRDIRRAGAATLDLAWTAAGRYDGFFEAPLRRWDSSAGVLIVREAGGRAEELEAVGPSGSGAIAAGPALFDPLRALVEESRPTARR